MGTCLNALVEMLFMEHQVTKPQLRGVGRGEEGWGGEGRWRNHCTIGGSKNPACQGL